MSKDLSKWRIQKAQITLTDGEQLEHTGSYHSAINRYYYAAFHAVRALLATKEFDSAKHSGVISYFNKEFVKAGIISKASSRAIQIYLDSALTRITMILRLLIRRIVWQLESRQEVSYKRLSMYFKEMMLKKAYKSLT